MTVSRQVIENGFEALRTGQVQRKHDALEALLREVNPIEFDHVYTTSPWDSGQSIIDNPVSQLTSVRTLRPAWRSQWKSVVLIIVALVSIVTGEAMIWGQWFADSLSRALRQPTYTNVSSLVVLGVVTFIVFLFLGMVYRRFYHAYRVGPHGVESVEGIIARDERRCEYRNITNVRVIQTIPQRLLGIGTVQVASSGTGDYELSFVNVKAPQRVKHIIKERML